MNPAGPALAPQDPPPQYKPFYSATIKDKLYSEIICKSLVLYYSTNLKLEIDVFAIILAL
jgi:hypothetical protein